MHVAFEFAVMFRASNVKVHFVKHANMNNRVNIYVYTLRKADNWDD